MKYTSFIFGLLFLFMYSNMFAQAREVRQARNAIVQYHTSLNEDVSKLQEGVEIISGVIKTEEGANDFNARLEAGKIFSTAYIDPRIGGSNNPEFARKSYNNYVAALNLGSRRHQERDAAAGIAESAGILINAGVDHFELGNLETSLEFFELVFTARDILKEKGYETVLATEELYQEHAFRTAFMAYQSGNLSRAQQILEELYDAEADNAGVYEILAAIYINNEDDRAIAVLEKGLELYPDNKGLQYTELNYYLRTGELESLIDKLKKAIAGEPENPTLYSTLGNVYDNLYQKTFEAGDVEQSEIYFDEAYKYYSKAIEINPEFVDAVYSIGAMYFNRAAYITREMVELERDYSREATQRYSQLQKKVSELFDKALPYFLQAEALDPNDQNILIALQRIYANMDELEKAQEYRDRLNALQGGQ
jgi:tetratricopeptide (TPR) repeat protein